MDDGQDGDVPRIDRPILEEIRDRLAGAAQFDQTKINHAEGQLRLEIQFDPKTSPPSVEKRTLDVRWYTNDDFRLHYEESRTDGRWAMRWDRHPSTHNRRDHFHPPPTAATPGVDRDWPNDYRDVCSLVLEAIRKRTATLWERTG